MTKKTNRRELREKVLQILYAFEMNSEGLVSLTEGMLSDVEEKSDKDFCRLLIDNVLAHHKALDKRISERVDNWEMNRIALIDKILLRMCIAEILFFPDIPPKVSINEVIEISKNFSTPNSGKFINGILDSILAELKASGNLSKTGRGLVDESIRKNTETD
ncbi:MAG: transcription antitermination factor NusB [Ignavibacteriales bacterium]|nr:transcription antitermination factor NusB [Ignavibacteriales bacterium]